MFDLPRARLATQSDLPHLLALFAASPVSAAAGPGRVEGIWQATLAREGLYVFVSPAGTGAGPPLAATCTLITAPNPLRGGRQHGFLENVVTHPAHRRRGHGRAVIAAALEKAWAEDCFHVLLQSGRADPGVHQFYEKLGFQPGLRTAYVARPPRSDG